MTSPPITEGNFAAWLATPRAWAILPQTFSIVSLLAGGSITVAEAAERGTQRTAERATPSASAPGVALLSLRGLITPRGTFIDAICGGGGGLAAFQESLDAAVEDGDVGSILLDIDSPGGTSDLVSETAAMIREARSEKPVVAIANAMAASAAYWLASQAEEVVVTPSGLIGSIGVYTRHVDVSAAEERIGIATTLVHAGRYKVEGNPHEPLSREGRAHLQELVDDVYGQFVEDVAAGRGVSAAAVRDGYGQGRVLTAERAVAAGLADRVEPVHSTLGRMLGVESVSPPPEPAPPEPDPDDEIGAVAPSEPHRAQDGPGSDEPGAEHDPSRIARERLAALL